ncbi:MAG: glucuronate isomerase [Acidobacteria bacterium SCN 69-37]|nr:MAG: glucuronate isomerase [Acidobacteria bacterium SCN 69-37]
MSTFLSNRFLLHSDAAWGLYRDHAAPQPIVDYHCHLSPQDIAANRRFSTLTEAWLEGDHYKWRAMRANGVPERFCTGDADPYDKFLAWADTVPKTLRNPLYHWTHLELQRYFGIADRLNRESAPSIWARANERLATDALSVHGMLDTFRVQVVCTTDDPADSLDAHQAIRASGLRTRVYPTFRPDRALDVHQPNVFNPWVDRLAATANFDIVRFADFLQVLRRRHQDFHDVGGRLSDHGLNRCPMDPCDEAEAGATFDAARSGRVVDGAAAERFAAHMMAFFGRLDAEKGWTMQLHLGARRNASTRAMRGMGRDTGYDSIGDDVQADALGTFLDRLDREGALPKTIVYNVNPAYNYVFATMIGNFQDGSVPGKVQFGSGWWFLDQKEGMQWQMNALSNVGLLSRFVGMTTDSRSFLSFPRHEYFRRVLCNLLGDDIVHGELPDDGTLVGGLVEDVCFGNAARYFGFELPA